MSKTVLSCELSEILKTAGISIDDISLSSARVNVREWSSSVIATIDQGIANNLGAHVENEFIGLVREVDNLSPENLIKALIAFEGAGYVWNPQHHLAQRQVCRNPLKDLTL